MTWPSVDAPATAPTDHGDVRTQAYYAGGGDYFRSGYFTHGLFTGGAYGTQALTLNRVSYKPFWLPVRRTFDRIGINVTVASAAASGGVLRMGIYADGGGKPGTRVVDAGTVSNESTGSREITISQSLDPGLYWLAVVAQVATCTVTIYASTTLTPAPGPGETSAASSATNAVAHIENSVSGALPSPATPLTTTSQLPVLMLRAA